MCNIAASCISTEVSSVYINVHDEAVKPSAELILSNDTPESISKHINDLDFLKYPVLVSVNLEDEYQ